MYQWTVNCRMCRVSETMLCSCSYIPIFLRTGSMRNAEKSTCSTWRHHTVRFPVSGATGTGNWQSCDCDKYVKSRSTNLTRRFHSLLLFSLAWELRITNNRGRFYLFGRPHPILFLVGHAYNLGPHSFPLYNSSLQMAERPRKDWYVFD